MLFLLRSSSFCLDLSIRILFILFFRFGVVLVWVRLVKVKYSKVSN